METSPSTSCADCPVLTDSAFNQSPLAESFLKGHKQLISFKAGEYIFREGASPEGVYCVRQGQAEIIKKSYQQREVLLAYTSPGELLGITAVSEAVPHSTSARALTNIQLCFIPKEVILQLLAACPVVQRTFLKMLTMKLNKLDEVMHH